MLPKNQARHTLSYQLREIVESRGLTAYAVGQLAEVDPGVVSRFLTGQRDIRLETADRLALALGLRLTETGRWTSGARPKRPTRAVGRPTPAVPDASQPEPLPPRAADPEPDDVPEPEVADGQAEATAAPEATAVRDEAPPPEPAPTNGFLAALISAGNQKPPEIIAAPTEPSRTSCVESATQSIG